MRTTRSGESALLLLDVVDILTSQGIQYAVIGALAASIHGVVRASMDADAVVSLGLMEAKRLAQVLEAAQFHTELTRGDFEDPIPGLLRLSDGFGNRVDLLHGSARYGDAGVLPNIDGPVSGSLHWPAPLAI